MNRELEAQRTAGHIGSSLQAELTIRTNTRELAARLDSFGDDLKFLFVVSKVTVELASVESTEVIATASSAPKCDRCWHYRTDVGHDPAHPTICGRCTANLFGAGEPRRAA